jgi:hypothetical protein
MKTNIWVFGITNTLILSLIFICIAPQQLVSATPEGWNEDLNVSNSPENSGRPDIITDSLNNVHIVWADGKDGGGIFYRKYDGNEWSNDVHLDSINPSASSGGTYPAIALDSEDHLHVVFVAPRVVDNRQEIFYVNNTYDVWSTPERVTWGAVINGMIGVYDGLEITIDTYDRIYVFWSADRTALNDDEGIWYIVHDEGGWSEIREARNDGINHMDPAVTGDLLDNIHLVYTTLDPAGMGAYYNISYQKFNGNTWTSPIFLDDSGFSRFPVVAPDSVNNVHIVWMGDVNYDFTYNIYYTKLDNNGFTLVNDLKLTSLNNCSYPNLFVDSEDNINIIFSQGTGTPKWYEYYLKLDNGGNILLGPINLTTTYIELASERYRPPINIDSRDVVHIAVSDNRDGNSEVYYKFTKSYDLSIASNDIQFSNHIPQSGENVFINATIHNDGGYLTNGTIYFYIDSIEEMNLIGSESVSIPRGEYDTGSVEWSAMTGNHIIWVNIECEDGITESNTTNNIANKTITVNDPPTINVTNPLSGIVNVDISYTISWIAKDPDDDAEIRLYYDSDNTGCDGIQIDTSNQYPSGIIDNNGVSQSYDWNTMSLPDDSIWYIYARIEDVIHAPVHSYSQGMIKIDHPNIPPIVKITSPTGGTVSGLVTIQGTANDPDKNNIHSVFVSIDDKFNWKIASGTNSWGWDWDTTEYSDGEHTIYAKAYDGEDSSDIVYVTVTVDNGGNKAPLVSITYPSDGDTVSGEIKIRGTASDNDGFVQLVELRIDDEVWIELPGTTNWNLDWDTIDYSNGEHTIKARAKDDLGVYSQEKSIIVIVNNGGNILPSVKITSHSGGEVVSGEVKIRGTAVDHDGNVELVEVRIDDDNNNWITVAGTTTWTFTWDTTTYSNGEHVIYARAKDDYNEYSQMKSVTLIVNNGGNIPPIVNIVSPTSGTLSGLVSIRGTATDLDGDGTIVSVQVKIDDNWENADGIIDWSYEWDTTILNDDNYTIYVRAYDGIDYSTVKSVTFYINNPHKPILTITSKIPKEVSGTLNIRGTAFDSDGEVTKVEIQIDDGEWKEIEGTTDWSYKLDTTKLSDGEHTIRIRVYDNEGEQHTEIFNITVSNMAWIPWFILAIGIVILAIILIVIIILRKKKVKSRIESTKTQQIPQTGMQTLRCPKCNNVFEVLQYSAFVQCPYCGLRGNVT